MVKHIRARVDELFEGPEQPNSEWLRALLASLESSWKDADKAENHSFVALFASWAIAAAIGTGVISGGTVASLTFSNIGQLLIVAPPVVAFFAYRYMLFGSVSVLLWNSVSQIYKHVLPKAYDLGLDELIGVGTVASAQRVLEPDSEEKGQRRVHMLWMLTIVIGGVLGPLIAIIHIASLLWASGKWSPLLVTLSTLVAALIYARSILLIAFVGETYLNPQTGRRRRNVEAA